MTAEKRQPDLAGRPTDVAARVRLRYAKRGRLRFTSHRDITRAFERAIRRAGVPMAYSSGFTAHPRISWIGAAPTGAASEAEYVELGICEPGDPQQLARDLDAALPPGIDILDAVIAQEGAGKLADRIDGSCWKLELHGVTPADLEAAVSSLLAASAAPVERLTKDGRRTLDVRSALVSATVLDPEAARSEYPADSQARVSPAAEPSTYAILGVVVQQTTPVVRPDDVVAALITVAGLPAPVSSLSTRMAQGRLLEDGSIADPLAADRDGRVVSA